MTNHALFTPAEVVERIRLGRKLVLAADENLLRSLPQGDWIGATMPYFIGQNGGEFSKEKIFVSDLTDYGRTARFALYSEAQLPQVTADSYEEGFTVLILPFAQTTHLSFALNAPSYPNNYLRPIIGLISGVALDEIGLRTAKTFFGPTSHTSETEAVALHLELPAGKVARIESINLFQPGSGDALTFPEAGFDHHDVIVNGERQPFATYLAGQSADSRLPLVANLGGASVNISFQRIDEVTGIVHLYAPLFPDTTYHLAESLPDYVEAFTSRLPTNTSNIAFACNCILNYAYSELEGKQLGGLTCPITFGEVAYQLLNQTFTYLVVE